MPEVAYAILLWFGKRQEHVPMSNSPAESGGEIVDGETQTAFRKGIPIYNPINSKKPGIMIFLWTVRKFFNF